MFSKLGGTISKLDPLRGGDRILEAVGAPTLTGQGDKNILDMGATAAAQAQADAAKAAQEAADAANAQQEATRQQQAADAARLRDINSAAGQDLSKENLSQVVAGGTADIMSADTDLTKKRRSQGGLASTLGLNV